MFLPRKILCSVDRGLPYTHIPSQWLKAQTQAHLLLLVTNPWGQTALGPRNAPKYSHYFPHREGPALGRDPKYPVL